MKWLERLLPDPETPLEPSPAMVPDEIEADEPADDLGDAEGALIAAKLKEAGDADPASS